MALNTILLLLLALVVAAGIAFYQYLFKAKNHSRLNWFLAFLRFLSIFLIMVLLINPVISRKTYETQKTPLPVVVDNSESIAFLEKQQQAKSTTDLLINNTVLKEKYDLQFFSFDEDLNSEKPLDFTGKRSNIHRVFENLKQLYRNQNYPIVLLTDGNQTEGDDYVFDVQPEVTVFPVVLGDTIEHLDLKINQLNTNKYAFLKNKFPVEAFLYYNGHKPVTGTFSIQENGKTIYKQSVSFSSSKKSQEIAVLLNADKVGVHTYKAVISSTENEKNKFNNSKNFAVEIIDQRSEIALVSSISHPDLGAIKRSIETNVQRKVTLVKPNEIKELQNFNVLILYQPNAEFRSILDQNSNLKLNTFVITGLNTDFNLLNRYQNHFDFKMVMQKEDYSADFDSDFNLFAIDNLGFEQFPPLENPFGTITPKGNTNTLLKSRIRNVSTENPLLTYTENGINRNAYLFGENLWKWRMESHLKEKSFEKFDLFLDKTIQFLASNTKKKSLVVNHESFYNSGENIVISAQYFNKNYEFDENALLTILLKNKSSNTYKVYDFSKGSNDFQVNFQDLDAGNYSFVVKEKRSNTQHTGSFQILDFDAEKQFTNADLSRLKQLAQNTEGKTYSPSNVVELIRFLEKSTEYRAVQKAVITRSPLIEWVWGLLILAFLLATEWFVRKYNGLL